MADQVQSIGSLMQSAPLAQLAAAAPKSSEEKPRPLKMSGSPSAPSAAPGNAEAPGMPEAAMEQINSHLQQMGSELQFQVDQGTGRTVFKIISPSDGKVLIQVPSEELLAMARNLRAMEEREAASGVLLDREG